MRSLVPPFYVVSSSIIRSSDSVLRAEYGTRLRFDNLRTSIIRSRDASVSHSKGMIHTINSVGRTFTKYSTFPAGGRNSITVYGEFLDNVHNGFRVEITFKSVCCEKSWISIYFGRVFQRDPKRSYRTRGCMQHNRVSLHVNTSLSTRIVASKTACNTRL